MSIGTNWAGNHEYRASRLHRPRTVGELQQVVAGASRIRGLGSRHSFNDLADSAELVTLDDLSSDIRIDADTETVSCSAGVRYTELAHALEAEGWALPNLASLPHISVAGAISTGTHGSGVGNGTLARAVTGIDLVTADGGLRQIVPADPEFDGAIVSLGALGILSRVTLDIEPSFAVRQDVYEGLSWESLFENWTRIMSAAYSVSVFTRFSGETAGHVVLKSRVPGARPPAEIFGATAATTAIHPLAGEPAETTTEQLGAPGPWNERLPHFRSEFRPSSGEELQSEYIVPGRHALDAIRAVRELETQLTPLVKTAELRMIAADSLWLSGAYQTDAVGLHFTWSLNPEAVLQVLPVLESALAPFDARPHWGKLFDTAPRHLYPRLGDFVELAHELDPRGIFRNDFLDKHVF